MSALKNVLPGEFLILEPGAARASVEDSIRAAEAEGLAWVIHGEGNGSATVRLQRPDAMHWLVVAESDAGAAAAFELALKHMRSIA